MRTPRAVAMVLLLGLLGTGLRRPSRRLGAQAGSGGVPQLRRWGGGRHRPRAGTGTDTRVRYGDRHRAVSPDPATPGRRAAAARARPAAPRPVDQHGRQHRTPAGAAQGAPAPGRRPPAPAARPAAPTSASRPTPSPREPSPAPPARWQACSRARSRGRARSAHSSTARAGFAGTRPTSTAAAPTTAPTAAITRTPRRRCRSKVFAFVGSFSLYDGCGAGYIKPHDIPDFHVQLDPRAGRADVALRHRARGRSATRPGCSPTTRRSSGARSSTSARSTPTSPRRRRSRRRSSSRPSREGWKFVYTRAAAATEIGLDAGLRQDVQAEGRADLLHVGGERRQRREDAPERGPGRLPDSLINIIPIAYDQAFVQDAGGSKRLEGLMGWNEY